MKTQVTEMKTKMEAMEKNTKMLVRVGACDVTWDVELNKLVVPDKNICSKQFDVSTAFGIYKCRLFMCLSTDGHYIEIYLQAEGEHYPVSLEGTRIDCCGNTTIFDETYFLNDKSNGRGSPCLTYQEALDGAVDGHIQVTASIQLTPGPIKLANDP